MDDKTRDVMGFMDTDCGTCGTGLSPNGHCPACAPDSAGSVYRESQGKETTDDGGFWNFYDFASRSSLLKHHPEAIFDHLDEENDSEVWTLTQGVGVSDSKITSTFEVPRDRNPSTGDPYPVPAHPTQRRYVNRIDKQLTRLSEFAFRAYESNAPADWAYIGGTIDNVLTDVDMLQNEPTGRSHWPHKPQHDLAGLHRALGYQEGAWMMLRLAKELMPPDQFRVLIAQMMGEALREGVDLTPYAEPKEP